MTSGAAAITSCGETIRSLADLCSQFGKHVLAAGDLDQFRDPADPADERIVPFLEINLGPRATTREAAEISLQASFIAPRERFRLA